MYAVIFRATINTMDEEYAETAQRMRALAMGKYGCIEFTAVTEGQQEIAISYWKSLEQITRWKQDPEHQQAQQLGREKWYSAWQVQIVDILREYNH